MEFDFKQRVAALKAPEPEYEVAIKVWYERRTPSRDRW
jgi:hypothetical protein